MRLLLSAPQPPVGEPPPADPAPVLALGHCFYTSVLGRARSLQHPPAQLSGRATLTADALVLHFRAPTDELYFELARPQLASWPPWVAAYPLRCQSQPLAPAALWYYHTRAEATPLHVSRLHLSSQAAKMRGHVVITAYDAQRQLLSGYYEVRAHDQRDPSSPAAAPSVACTIILAGDFDFVKLQPG